MNKILIDCKNIILVTKFIRSLNKDKIENRIRIN